MVTLFHQRAVNNLLHWLIKLVKRLNCSKIFTSNPARYHGFFYDFSKIVIRADQDCLLFVAGTLHMNNKLHFACIQSAEHWQRDKNKEWGQNVKCKWRYLSDVSLRNSPPYVWQMKRRKNDWTEMTRQLFVIYFCELRWQNGGLEIIKIISLLCKKVDWLYPNSESFHSTARHATDEWMNR